MTVPVGTQQWSVKAGTPQRLAANLSAGTTIRNMDTVNAVWVSEFPNVAPGNGWKLTALGSFVWQNTSDCYVCVDTGVAGPVTVTYGGRIGAIQDPVAVAQAINAQGVPLVYTETLIDSGTLANTNGTSFLNLSNYASVRIKIKNDPNVLAWWTWDQWDGSDWIAQDEISIYDANPVSIQAPVVAPQGRLIRNDITGPGTGTARYWIYGSNRPVTRSRTISGITNAQKLTWNGTLAPSAAAMFAGTAFGTRGGGASVQCDSPFSILLYNTHTNPTLQFYPFVRYIDVGANNFIDYLQTNMGAVTNFAGTDMLSSFSNVQPAPLGSFAVGVYSASTNGSSYTGTITCVIIPERTN